MLYETHSAAWETTNSSWQFEDPTQAHLRSQNCMSYDKRLENFLYINTWYFSRESHSTHFLSSYRSFPFYVRSVVYNGKLHNCCSWFCNDDCLVPRRLFRRITVCLDDRFRLSQSVVFHSVRKVVPLSFSSSLTWHHHISLFYWVWYSAFLYILILSDLWSIIFWYSL